MPTLDELRLARTLRARQEQQDAEAALALVQSGDALIKNFSATFAVDAAQKEVPNINVDFLFEQLNDPMYVRPFRQWPDSVDRTKVYNPATGKVYTRKIKGERGRAKMTKFTKKTACTLLPPHGRINLYRQRHSVAVLFDSRQCRLSEKYIFAGNAITNDRWWLAGANQRGKCRATPLPKLKKALHLSAGMGVVVPHHNELLVRLQLSAAASMVVTDFSLMGKLNAQHRRNQLAKYYRHLPLLILNPAINIAAYEPRKQDMDVEFGKLQQGVTKQLAERIDAYNQRLDEAVLAEQHWPASIQILALACFTRGEEAEEGFKAMMTDLDAAGLEELLAILLDENDQEMSQHFLRGANQVEGLIALMNAGEIGLANRLLTLIAKTYDADETKLFFDNLFEKEPAQAGANFREAFNRQPTDDMFDGLAQMMVHAFDNQRVEKKKYLSRLVKCLAPYPGQQRLVDIGLSKKSSYYQSSWSVSLSALVGDGERSGVARRLFRSIWTSEPTVCSELARSESVASHSPARSLCHKP